MLEFSTLVFCNDGHIRVKTNDTRPLIPLIAIQEYDSVEEYPFMIKFMENRVILEKGLTIGSFFKCLMPWHNFFTSISGTNISLYMDEVKNPIDVSGKYAMINHNYDISPDVIYNSNSSDFDINEFIDNMKNPDTVEILPSWNINCSYEVVAYNVGEEEHYGIEHLTMDELYNIPLYINPVSKILVNDFNLKKKNMLDKTLLSDSCLGAVVLDHEYGSFKYVVASKELTLGDVVKGFFSYFSYSPTHRDDLTNIIMNNSQQILPDNSEYLEEVLSMSLDSDIPIKIGNIEENVPPEKRVFQYIDKG